MMDCTNWQGPIFKAHLKELSSLRNRTRPVHVPEMNDADWQIWKVLPHLDHGQRVADLYDITALEKALRDHPCAQATAEAQVAEQLRSSGVTYGAGFYAGLALAGVAVALSFRRKR